jgi:uncharacterized protein (TIGR04255 family)
MAEKRQYAHAPITEAVLELRFDETLSQRDMERLHDRFKSAYSTVEMLQEIEMVFEGTKVEPTLRAAGFKMTDRNAVDVLMLKPATFGTIRLAPYEDWERFSGKAKENWELFTKVLGRKRVIRIGCRFINRIDIPNKLLDRQRVTELFLTHITLPSEIGYVVGSFAFGVETVHKVSGAKLIIHSGIAQPPALLEHTSVTLDVDAYWDTEIPLRVDEMWAKADLLRAAKNDVFESSITDELRALFQ